MNFQPVVDASKEWLNRAGTRWADAAKEIEKGTYEPQHLFRDVLTSWVSDPVKWLQVVVSSTTTPPPPDAPATPPPAEKKATR